MCRNFQCLHFVQIFTIFQLLPVGYGTVSSWDVIAWCRSLTLNPLCPFLGIATNPVQNVVKSSVHISSSNSTSAQSSTWTRTTMIRLKLIMCSRKARRVSWKSTKWCVKWKEWIVRWVGTENSSELSFRYKISNILDDASRQPRQVTLRDTKDQESNSSTATTDSSVSSRAINAFTNRRSSRASRRLSNSLQSARTENRRVAHHILLGWHCHASLS